MSAIKKTTQKIVGLSLADTLQQLTGGFDFLVSQTPIIVSIIDKNGRILYQSPNIVNILGYESNSRIGKNFIKSKYAHPEDLFIKKQLLEKTFTNPNKNFVGELRLLHKDGTWRWMQVIFNNQLQNPAVKGIVVITQDIHERKLLELQKNEFLSVASHELKTPLTTIRAYSQLLSRRWIRNHGTKKDISFLENILYQTDKLTGLIDDLLDVSKLQEGKFLVKMKPFQMQSLIRKITEDFHYISESHTIELTQTTKTFVIGDEFRIAQVMTNLLTNAIKYSPETFLVQIKIIRKGQYVVTSVADQGVGIPAKKQKFVFDRFYQVEKNAAQKSSGLGLYISSEIIKLHKGKIWLESKKGKGSTFYFSLPVAPTKKV